MLFYFQPLGSLRASQSDSLSLHNSFDGGSSLGANNPKPLTGALKVWRCAWVNEGKEYWFLSGERCIYINRWENVAQANFIFIGRILQGMDTMCTRCLMYPST